jgi:hypothetical protein
MSDAKEKLSDLLAWADLYAAETARKLERAGMAETVKTRSNELRAALGDAEETVKSIKSALAIATNQCDECQEWIGTTLAGFERDKETGESRLLCLTCKGRLDKEKS